jgi:hypothetical protein
MICMEGADKKCPTYSLLRLGDLFCVGQMLERIGDLQGDAGTLTGCSYSFMTE